MTTPGWAILSAVIYLVLIFTLALMTFRKGHWVLGIIGFIFPLLWLIGAIISARRAVSAAASAVPHSRQQSKPSRALASGNSLPHRQYGIIAFFRRNPAI